MEAIRRGSLVITLIHDQTSLLAKNQQRKKFQILNQNHRLTVFKKFQDGRQASVLIKIKKYFYGCL